VTIPLVSFEINPPPQEAGRFASASEERIRQRPNPRRIVFSHTPAAAAPREARGPRSSPEPPPFPAKAGTQAFSRSAERRQVRWLRPDCQIPRFAKGAAAKTGELALDETVVAIDKCLPAFPPDRYEQPLVVEAILAAAARPMTAAELARGFKRGGKRIEQRVTQVLATLARYGRVSALPDGTFSARRAA